MYILCRPEPAPNNGRGNMYIQVRFPFQQDREERHIKSAPAGPLCSGLPAEWVNEIIIYFGIVPTYLPTYVMYVCTYSTYLYYQQITMYDIYIWNEYNLSM